MSTPSPVRGTVFYGFGPFLVDPVRRLLWRDRRVVPLTSRSFDVLWLLLQNRDRVVDKDEFLAEIWHETVVEEGTLVRHISSLRKAMQLRPEQHDYIVTVTGRGYRFVSHVVELDDLPADLPTTVPPAVVAADAAVIEQAAELAPFVHPVTDVMTVADPGRAVDPNDSASIPPAPGRSRWAEGLRWAPWVIVAVIAGAAALSLLAQGKTAESQARGLRQVTFGAGLQHEPTWSPDGQSLAYTSDRNGNVDVWVQSTSDPNPIRLTSSPSHDWQPDWSPDGKWIAFRSERDGGGIWIVPARGGQERRLTTSGYRPRWSPDTAKILFLSSALRTSAARYVFVVGLDGQPPVPVRPDVTRELRNLNVAWHPDGRVSFSGVHRTTGRVFLTASLNGTEATGSTWLPEVDRRLQHDAVTLGGFVWAPSAGYLYFEGRSNGVRNLWRVTIDPITMAWTGGPDRLTTGTGNDTDMAISRDGTKLAFTSRSEQTRVWSFPFDSVSGALTGRAEPITPEGMNEQGPDILSLSNGNKVVYRVSLGNHSELREFSFVDRRERVLIGGKEGNRTNARWSPDGASLAYNVQGTSAESTGKNYTAILGRDGIEHIVTTPGSSWNTTGWSPDGQSLLGSCRRGTAPRLAVCLLPLSYAPYAERAISIVTANPEMNLYQAQFSPDRRWILFQAIPTFEGGISTINIVSPTGGSWTSITEGHSYEDKPRWAPDGRTVYFVSNRDGLLNVWGRRFDPVSGQPVGPTFRVTAFDTLRKILSPDSIGAIEIAVAHDRLVLPITEASAAVWALDRIDR